MYSTQYECSEKVEANVEKAGTASEQGAIHSTNEGKETQSEQKDKEANVVKEKEGKTDVAKAGAGVRFFNHVIVNQFLF